ncbi:hypothetical protein [Corynebacterium sp. A21]|uniref:hypothetical protein n=1 Tax=Corynebacterium sp. A21 TaxID=3457318 RepID=UPI003FD4EAEB
MIAVPTAINAPNNTLIPPELSSAPNSCPATGRCACYPAAADRRISDPLAEDWVGHPLLDDALAATAVLWSAILALPATTPHSTTSGSPRAR